MNTNSCRPFGRLFYWPLMIALLGLTVGSGWAQQKTRVMDSLYKADGSAAQGTLLISFGESQLSRAANNFFGIKAHGKHPVMEFRTCEFIATGETKIVARFAVYSDMIDCFECRDRLISNGAAYSEARDAKNDPAEFAARLAKHWATDPKYAEKLLRIYRDNGFEKLDVK
jgi:flagellum-specific peptidoglycan hydrolase FlgJ